MPRAALLLLLLLAAAFVPTLASDDDGDDDENDDHVVDDSDDVAEAAVDAGGAPVLEVRGGRIRGKVLTSAGGRRYLAYLGVPYAKPPIGDRRFKFARRLDAVAWRGVRACDEDAPKCAQLSYPERQFEGDEDCLYLNVYTHRVEDRSLSVEELVPRLRPVLVWLHGGNFQHGSGTFDDVGPERFMDNEDDIVLVVPNYRLNALGFLSIGEHPAVGNAGMKDVFTVLTWVHGNIPQFGGHPGSITLAGAQAGGAAAHLHALSPLSSLEPDMFQQTLSMSGSALAPWAVLPAAEARRRALRLARALGCVKAGVPDEAAAAAAGPDAVRCLRTRPAEDIVRASDAVLDWHSDLSFAFVPSVERFDGHNRPFMIATPEEVLRTGGAGLRAGKTWITGITTHDGLPQALQMMVFRGLLRELNERFEEVVWDYLGMRHVVDALPAATRRALGRRLRDHYLPADEDITLGSLSGLIDLTSDALYTRSMYRAALLHADAGKAPVLVYRFGFDRHVDRTRVLGVPLGTDTELMFPAVFAKVKSNMTKEEAVISKKLLQLLTNFVTMQDPTPEEEDLLNNIAWPPVKSANFSFMDVSVDGEFSVATEFYTDRMALWDLIFEELKRYQTAKNDESDEDKRNKTKDEL